MNELEQLHRDVAAWEKQADGMRQEAITLDAAAQRKWNDVEALEARIAKDLAAILELEG